MSAIGPGDWVECVSLNCGCETARPDDAALFLSEGSSYRVTRVGRAGNGDEAVEIADWPDTPFCPGHFRPTYREDPDLIESLKQPAPERETEDA